MYRRRHQSFQWRFSEYARIQSYITDISGHISGVYFWYPTPCGTLLGPQIYERKDAGIAPGTMH